MPYSDGSPTLGEQVEQHMETRAIHKELTECWDEGYAEGKREGLNEAADFVANMCRQERSAECDTTSDSERLIAKCMADTLSTTAEAIRAMARVEPSPKATTPET